MREPAGADPLHPYKDVLKIRVSGPDGELWVQDAKVVPRVGDGFMVMRRDKTVTFDGTVQSVTWAVVEGGGGLIAIVRVA